MRHRTFVYRSGTRRSAESRIQRWIRWNCWLSMWLAIGVFSFWVIRMDVGFGGAFSPLSGRILAGALGFIAVESLLWFFVVRKGGIEARWAAGLMGAYFVVALLIMSAWASLGTSTSTWIVAFFIYGAASHLAYGIFGSRARGS